MIDTATVLNGQALDADQVRSGSVYRNADHTYWYAGQRIPSVTGAINAAGLVDARWFTPAARDKGTAVHAFTEWLDRRLPVDVAPMIAVGECQAYRKFLDDYGPVWATDGIESARVHTTRLYGGKADRYADDLLGGPAVLEIKTGAPSSWHGVQLAGYQGLRPTGARFVLYLRPDGTYRLIRCRELSDYRTFAEALEAAWTQLRAA